MLSIERPTPDCLRVREGAGRIGTGGTPFIIGGVILLLVATGVIPAKNPETVAWYAWPIFFLIGMMCVTVGVVFTFGRRWTTFDRTQRTVVQEWGLLVPFRQRRFSLDDYAAITIDLDRGDADTVDTFPVGLRSSNGGRLRIGRGMTSAESRACAKAVAEHVGLRIEDDAPG
jgi:hypothetical protein